jgi:thiol-disulfide isomerase/thioredoxin
VEGWQTIREQISTAGKPVVVDVWSLACDPCMREFPGLVKLQATYGDGLACVSVNSDFDGRAKYPPENYLSRVNAFLEAVSAKTTNYICSTPNEDLYGALEIPSIPAVLVFDAAGKEVKRFVDVGETAGFTYEDDVIPFVEAQFDLQPVPPQSESDSDEVATSPAGSAADATTEDSSAIDPATSDTQDTGQDDAAEAAGETAPDPTASANS